MNNNFKKPELLSPAGSPDAFYAALSGGADAIYLGGGEFNARMGAKNFSADQLERAVYHAHLKGVKVYITLNTLLGDLEISKAAEFAHTLYSKGADAFIVQDLGLCCYLKECIPDIPLHASTQMAVHNAEGAKFLQKYGFSRMVICREASKQDLELLCRNSPIETEMFIHGAVCVCQSGQCLMSSFIGRRSGNRGECAQPCRLTYNGSKPLLSIPDMCLAQHIPEISSLGVASLKIEGRMKSPEYVYGVTSIYRQLIDQNRNAYPQEISILKDLFSRGFSDSYFAGKKIYGGAIRTDKDKQASLKAQKALSQTVSRNIKSLLSQPYTPQSPTPEFCPPRAPKSSRGMKKPKKSADFGLRLVFCNRDGFDNDLLEKLQLLDYGDKYLEGIYLPLNSSLPKAKDIYGVITPCTVKDTALCQFDKMLQNGTNLGYKKCLVRNVSHISLVENADYSVHGAMELNVYNSESVKFWREYGVESVTLSCECLMAQIRDIDKYKMPCSVVIYGRIPLMYTELCLLGNCENCSDDCRKKSRLYDRTQASFPVFADGLGHNVIYNCLPLYAADRIKALKDYGVGIGTMFFTDESPQKILQTVESYIKEINPDGNFTRGYLG